MGPGCALFDLEGDGDLDIYFVNGSIPPGGATPAAPPRNRLFRQEADGTFVDATEASGLGDPGYGMGVAVGDVDNDGFPDLYVTNFGANALYRNRGDGSFEDATERAGVGHLAWSASAAFFDFDGDGFLDLYVANYLVHDPRTKCTDASGRPDYCGPEKYPGAPDALYRNRGDRTFEDRSLPSGVGAAALRGLGVVCGDLTGDGRPDVYVANDGHPNLLWVNRGDGAFVDEAVERGAAFDQAGHTQAGMGVLAEDLDGDGDLDLVVTNLRSEGLVAYRNDGRGVFSDATARMGLLGPSIRFTGFGVAALDFDHDGDLDLAAVNGHVFRGPVEPGAALGGFWNEYAQPGLLLRNEGGGRFADASAEAGSFGASPQVGRGLAVGDLDGDGDLDLATTACNGRARVFRNEAPKRGRWLLVRAFDPRLRRDALGALVTVVLPGGRLVRRVASATSYLSSADPRAHFGWQGTAVVEEILVEWPDGLRERFRGVEADRTVTLRRGEGS